MGTDLVVRDGRIVLPEGIIQGELSIENGMIKRIALTGIPRGDQEIRARGRLVMPGVVDGHAHFYSRKYVYRESFRTGSIAAAAGGVTTVGVSPLDYPINTVARAEEIIRTGESSSMVDFILHAGNITPGFARNLVKLASMGIRSFKVSNCFPSPCTYEGMEKVMDLAARLECIVIAYPEDAALLKELRKKMMREGKRDILAYVQGHPPEAEERGITRISELASRVGCPVHIAPVTTASGCRAVSKFKEMRSRITSETCPHYLTFTLKDLERLGARLKVAPPVREADDRSALWEAVESGLIDIITSGHAPTTRAEKEMGKINVWGTPSGVPSLETMLPVMFTEGVVKGRITVERLVALLSSRPAQLFGIYPRKGVIREGSDADLVLLDVRNEMRIRAENLHYPVEWTPYEGMRVRGIPFMTLSRGEVIMREGIVESSGRRGKFLKRGEG
jgi:dihydroorotase (multifunctional complex type)